MPVYRLCLMRHAEAEAPANPFADQNPSIPLHKTQDFNRQLTPHGMIQAVHAGKQLQPFMERCQRFLISSAVRTKQTADLVARPYLNDHAHFDENLYIAATSEDIVRSILKHTDKTDENIMVIGHNPVLSGFASELTGNYLDYSPSEFSILEIDAADLEVALNSWNCWQEKFQ